MRFDHIVGQHNVIKNIKTSLSNGRVAHAYLFCGPDGVGKSLVASAFAESLNCKDARGGACEKCSSCLRAESGNHPDIIHLKTKKASISIGEIREIHIDAQKKPYENGMKVYIIHEADKMTVQAQNALLKTLEEPPRYVVFILLTVNQYSLLSTITSRCQILKFFRAPERDVEAYLRDKLRVPEDEARFISAFSGGIMENALNYLKDEEVKKGRESIIEMARGLRSSDKIHALSRVDYFVENKDKIDYILEVMMAWFRDIMIFKECGDSKYLINLDKAQMVMDERHRFTFDGLNNIIETIKQTSINLKSNVNFQLSIENMLLNIQEG